MKLPNRALIALLLLWCNSGPAIANEHEAVLPYLADDVAAVAFVDLDKVDVPAVVSQFAPIIGLSDEERQAASVNAMQGQARIAAFRDLGVRRIYALLRTSDVAHGGVTWVAPVAAGSGPKKVVAMLEAMLHSSTDRPGQGPPLPRKLGASKGFVLAAMNDDQLAMLVESRRKKDNRREDATAALVELGDHGAGLVVFGDADSRRVVREMFPQLPAPLDAIDGRLLADGLQWGGVTLDLPPNPRVEVVFQANDKDTATTFETVVNNALKLGKTFIQRQTAPAPEEVFNELAAAFNRLSPQVDNTRVSLTVGDDPEDIAAITGFLAVPVQAARQASFRAQRMNQFKQIALGMLNYESSKGSYPPQAITDDEGRPLLSWRVQILPYMEQKALYDQFHLDEPWNSEHNLKLAATLPDFYLDPDPALRRKLAAEGRTTFVVPAGEQTVFHGRDGMNIRKITDGLSNTVLVVEVIPARAVVWTKPDDWEVDFDRPFEGVKRNDGRPFTAGFCDGHVRIISPDHDPDVASWPKLLTPAGGETIER